MAQNLKIGQLCRLACDTEINVLLDGTAFMVSKPMMAPAGVQFKYIGVHCCFPSFKPEGAGHPAYIEGENVHSWSIQVETHQLDSFRPINIEQDSIP